MADTFMRTSNYSNSGYVSTLGIGKLHEGNIVAHYERAHQATEALMKKLEIRYKENKFCEPLQGK